MPRDFRFRGKTLAELKKMSLEEFAKLCKSRVRRAILRGLKNERFMKVIRKVFAVAEGKSKKMVRTHLRSIPIIPQMVGQKIGVYKGNEFVIVEITPNMLGHRLGEFALTRKRLVHGKAGIGATKSSTAIASRK
ncbi:MAG: 30S ribosomal protein S19 [Candidatus Diapherotrites archaeon]|nr:30S ribosomal protein S19 [Candidatus Diapherotrites archaeon]